MMSLYCFLSLPPTLLSSTSKICPNTHNSFPLSSPYFSQLFILTFISSHSTNTSSHPNSNISFSYPSLSPLNSRSTSPYINPHSSTDLISFSTDFIMPISNVFQSRDIREKYKASPINPGSTLFLGDSILRSADFQSITNAIGPVATRRAYSITATSSPSLSYPAFNFSDLIPHFLKMEMRNIVIQAPTVEITNLSKLPEDQRPPLTFSLDLAKSFANIIMAASSSHPAKNIILLLSPLH